MFYGDRLFKNMVSRDPNRITTLGGDEILLEPIKNVPVVVPVVQRRCSNRCTVQRRTDTELGPLSRRSGRTAPARGLEGSTAPTNRSRSI